MNFATAIQMRELDRRTMTEGGVPGTVLMERAGLGVAQIIRQQARCRHRERSPVLLAAGCGNNGGDAFVAARHLAQMGFTPRVFLATTAHRVQGDAAHHLELLRRDGIPLIECPDVQDWSCEKINPPAGSIFVDGLLGTGITGAPRRAVAAAIRFLNQMAGRGPIVSIDIPSGLNADSGQAEGDAVKADLTIAIALPKTGFSQPAALEYLGRLEVVDIGIPKSFLPAFKNGLELITASEVRSILPRRRHDSHKGNYGHLLIIAGARGFTGAAALAIRAAIRSGCGLVSAVVPCSLVNAIASQVPEAMVYPGNETETGSLAPDALAATGRPATDFTAIVAGPGLSQHDVTRQLVKALLVQTAVPLLLDADALNVIAPHPELLRTAKAPVIITPHPGEMARLMGTTAAEIQSDRLAAVKKAAELTGAIVILKGAGTLTAQTGQTTYINICGNPGMAKGGMGDVLSGLAGGILAQKINPLQAACAAVYTHASAGDLAAAIQSKTAMSASDIVKAIPAIFRFLENN
jgi:NAD(P)H-hydrate epimerase